MRCLLVVVLFCASAFAERKSYEGYQAVRIPVQNEATLQLLAPLYERPGFDFWAAPRLGSNTEVLVPPELQDELVGYLKRNLVQYEIFLEDVQSKIDSERAKRPRQRGHKASITFDQFYTAEEIYAYLDELQTAHPELVSTKFIGSSFEGRDIMMATLSTGGNGTKPAIFIDGGIHAREWIAPAAVTYILYQLVENYTANSHLLDSLDWFIVPVVNPDGYDYTFTDDRFWRKNRARFDASSCVGVDPNRNFGYHWNEGGTSSNPCSEIFSGSNAFSELESQAIRDAVLANAERVQIYLTYHSNAECIVYPWSYTDELPDNWQDLQSLAEEASAAVQAVQGSYYPVAQSTEIFGATAGSSDDWSKGGAGIAYAYTFELGGDGFDLPESQILSVSKEAWAGASTFANGFLRRNK